MDNAFIYYEDAQTDDLKEKNKLYADKNNINNPLYIINNPCWGIIINYYDQEKAMVILKENGIDCTNGYYPYDFSIGYEMHENIDSQDYENLDNRKKLDTFLELTSFKNSTFLDDIINDIDYKLSSN